MASLVKSKHTQQHEKQTKYRPMLCSLSNNYDDQVNQPLSPRRNSTSSSTSTSTSSSSEEEEVEPSSPRVGCMGQVKMKKYNNFVGFHAHISSCDNTSNQNEHHSNNNCNSFSMVKYINFRLKGFFSSRSLITNPTSAIKAAMGGAHKARRGRVTNIHINIIKETQMELQHPHPPRNSTGSRVALCRRSIDNNDKSKNKKGYCMVNLKEIDPPLPVLKRVPRQKQEEEERLSLWKRRSREVPLKSIQICQVMIQQKAQFYAKTV